MYYILHAVCTYAHIPPQLPHLPFSTISLATNMAASKMEYTGLKARSVQLGLHVQKCTRISRQHHCVYDLVVTWKSVMEQPS